jgi:hypothetical protein
MKKLKIGKSSIQGKGLFSGEPIKKGDLIAKVHSGIQMDPETIKYMPTQYGRFYNHEEKDFNTKNEIIGNHRYLRAIKNIPPNTELTANYREHPEMEQPEDFGKGKYASFDFDKTIATDEGLAKARQMIRDGYNLFIISAREKVTPDMVARARKAGIPEENIIATGSDEAKVKKVKQLGVEMHFDDKPEVISELGLMGRQFKKGGGVNSKKYTRSILGKNKLFVKNKLFKTKKVKNRIYDPNAKYFNNGGEQQYNNLPPTYLDALKSFVYPNVKADPRRTGHNALTNTISYDPESEIENVNNDWWMEHELFHELQNQAGGLSTSGIMGQRPNQYVASDQAIQSYYDRRDADVNRVVDQMIAENPELQFVPRERLIKGSPAFVGAESLQYGDPFTLEGEARQYEQYIEDGNPSIFPQKQNGGELPEDYQNFLDYSKTAPENRQPSENYYYMSPDEYDHYGMWDALGKPQNFEQALEMNPDWQPDEYDGMYHGFSVNPNTGVFLKSGKPGLKPGDTTWMEIAGHYLSPRANESTPVFDPELQRFKYIPKQGYGGDISIPRLNQFNNGGSSESISGAAGSTTCQLGYAWDKAKGMCVQIPNFKEYFTKWFKDRELPFDEIDNKKYVAIAKQMLPKYNPESTLLEEIANFSDPQYKETIANDPNVMGQVRYDEDYNPVGVDLKSSLLGDVKELGAIGSHEYSSLASFPYADKLFPAQNLVIDPGLVLFEDRWGDLKGAERDAAEEHYNYVTDPEQDNIHSMIFEERYKRDLKPQQKITEEDINNWKTEAEASGAFDRNSPNFNDTLYTLFKLAKDNKALMDWFNKLASNDRPKSDDDPQYAKQGGSIRYNLGDEIDESTMRKLKKLGYTFQKI